MSEDPTAASAEGPMQDNDDRSAGSLELFFDLVFVYAMSQVTALVLEDVSWVGFGHGLLALAAVWWAWVCYTWLTNTAMGSGAWTRVLIILAMAATLVAATALPQAFGNAAVVFGLAFGSVRVLHVGLLLLHARGDDDLRRAVLRLVPTLLTGPALVLMAAFVDSPYRELLWLIGAAVDFGGPVITGMAGWRVLPSYFVERHGQIIIIALGEAIVAVGAGAGDALARPGVLTAMVLGVLVSAALWWAYFGNIRTGAEQLMRSVRGVQRARLARDSYSYLHLALMAGIVYFALGVHETVAHPDQPLDLLLAVALCGGVALFFAGDVAYRWRDHHQLATDRLLAAVAALVVVPLALAMPALVALAVVAAVCAVWTGWETWYHPSIGPVQA